MILNTASIQWRLRHWLALLGLVVTPCLLAAGNATPHAVSIANLAFSPDHLSIHPGETVVWTNNDDRDHAVAAADGGFESKVLHHGDSFSFKFETAGAFHYGCKLHPRMKGLITVVAK